MDVVNVMVQPVLEIIGGQQWRQLARDAESTTKHAVVTRTRQTFREMTLHLGQLPAGQQTIQIVAVPLAEPLTTVLGPTGRVTTKFHVTSGTSPFTAPPPPATRSLVRPPFR
jgi:hypothetical protein